MLKISENITEYMNPAISRVIVGFAKLLCVKYTSIRFFSNPHFPA